MSEALPTTTASCVTTSIRRPPSLLLSRPRLRAAWPLGMALASRPVRPLLAAGAAARASATAPAGKSTAAASAERRRRRAPTPPPLPPRNDSAVDDEAPEARKNPELYGAAASGTTGAYTAAAEHFSPSATAATPSPPLRRRKPEVLAPAGGWPQLKAAVENGADAVYFGLRSGLNARARAANFAPEELVQVTDYLHARGVKGYLALNVLIFDEELTAFEENVRLAAAAGVDALIVQDVGAQEVARRAAPGLPVHGSTQMTITAPEGARFAASRGAKRVVVGRELSVREIAQVAAGSGSGGAAPSSSSSSSSTSSSSSPSTPSYEVEAFVHGALCVAYSGQCWSSEAWGGRSANRGQCAQQCRMPYALYVDGEVRELAGGERFLLSPQDLSGVAQVPGLVRAGVACLKIEGRLKGAEYVALATQTYRRAVDAAWEALALAGEVVGEEEEERVAAIVAAAAAGPAPKRRGRPPSKKKDPVSEAAAPGASPAAAAAIPSLDRLLEPVDGFSAEQAVGQQHLSDLRQLFSRGQDAEHDGLTPGFLEGPKHQRLVRGRAPRHRGLLLGRVRSVDPAKGRAVVEGPLPSAGVKNGDGVVFDDGRADEDEPGGPLYGVRVLERGEDGEESAAGARLVELQFAVGGGGAGGGSGGGGAAGGRRASSSSSSSASSPAAEQTRRMLRRVQPGDLVWKTKDHAAEQRARQSFESLPASAARRLRVSTRCEGGVGSPLLIEYRASDPIGGGLVVGRAETSVPLERAGKRPLLAQDVVAALGQLGDTTFALAGEEEGGEEKGESGGAVDLSGLALEQGLFIPASALKEARRAAAAALSDALLSRRRAARADGLADEPVVPRLLGRLAEDAVAASTSLPDKAAVRTTLPRLRVLCRTREQAEAAVGGDPASDDPDNGALPWLDSVVLDFLEVHGLAEAVQAVQAAGRRAVVALPRVLKPGEHRLLNFYLRLGADALLLRGAGALQQLLELGGAGASLPAEVAAKLPPGRPPVIPPLEGDFSLNVANALAADLLLGGSVAGDEGRDGASGAASTAAGAAAASGASQRMLSRLAPTHDLDAAQLARLARALGPERARESLEAIVYSHLAVFHTEHCVFCRFLSTGNDYRDCGHPCEKHALHLRDGEGRDNAVLADQGCRNTVFSSQAQSGAFELERLSKAGYGTLRIELVDEPANLVRPLLAKHRSVLRGEMAPGELWRWLSQLPDRHGRVQGVTSGSLRVRAEREAASLRPSARRA